MSKLHTIDVSQSRRNSKEKFGSIGSMVAAEELGEVHSRVHLLSVGQVGQG